MEAMHGAVVTLDYTLTLDGGEVVGREEGVEYLHGFFNIMTGLENGLEGINPGERRTVTLEPGEAFGEHDPERLITAPIAEVPDAGQLTPGMRITAGTARGPVELTVAEVNDDTIVFDSNHPLAGKRVHFDVDVTAVRPGLQHELRQGHPGPEACNTYS
jgi:FKBP-type peptidyl-prolyl cis-trans isomerase SlyD